MINEAISLVGYGVSNKAVYEYLKQFGSQITVRTKDKADVPIGTKNIFGDGYLNTCEELVFRSPSILPYRIKGNGRILCESEFALSHIICKKIGVTGSDGKTTVATLISKILEKSNNTYLGGNIGYPLINYVGKLKEDDFLVSELSSFQLYDMTPHLDVGVITNITPNHLDVHRDFSEYVSSKINILKNSEYCVLSHDAYKTVHSIGYFPKSGMCIASYDDMSGKLNDKFDFAYVKDGYIYFNEDPVVCTGRIKLKGDFNILNVCLAVGAAYGFSNKNEICEAIDGFYGVEGRMELIHTASGVKYYDSAIDSTPSRTLATLSAFNKAHTVIILGGYDKNLSYDGLYDGLENIKCAVICGANSKKIAHVLKNRCKFVLCDTFEDSVRTASRIAECGDSVLLSPASASYDMFENYKKKSDKYKEIVRGL